MNQHPRRRAITAAAAALATATLATLPALAQVPAQASTQANDRKVVEAFYSELLNASGPANKAEVAARLLADTWRSSGGYGAEPTSHDGAVKQIAGFHQMIPDLAWTIEDVIQSGDRFVVRGRATGTPKGPLFGVDGQGRSFTIMSIDIHRLAGSKLVESYHVEDWAGALRQLAAR